MKKILRLTSFCILHSAFCSSLLAQVASQPPYDGNATNVVRGDGSVGAFLGSSGATYAAVTNVLSLTGSTATFLRSDGTQSGTSTGTLTATNFTATGTGANTVPTGTTAERPANAAGQIRWNSTTSRFEHNIGASWENWVRLSGDTMTGPITAPRMTIGIANLTTLPVDGLFLTNTTAATVGVQVQDSPFIYWSGGAWISTPTSNAPVILRMGVVPTAGTTTPGGAFNIDSSLNNGAFANLFTMNIVPTGNSVFSGNVIAAASGFYYFSGRSSMSSSVNGAVEFNNQATTARSSVQANIPQTINAVNFTNAAALDSGKRYSNQGATAVTTNQLPTAVAGQHYWFHVDTNFVYSIRAASTDQIRWGSTLSAANGDIWSSQIGSELHLYCSRAPVWNVDTSQGTWTLVAPRAGNLTLIGGTLTVANTTVTANTIVLLTRKTSGGTIGTAITYTTSAATSFTVNSDNILDTSTFSWKLEEVPN